MVNKLNVAAGSTGTLEKNIKDMIKLKVIICLMMVMRMPDFRVQARVIDPLNTIGIKQTGANAKMATGQADIAETCFVGTIVIASQADVDNYITNYGGCTDMRGSIQISNVTDLSFLNNLTSLDGSLQIKDSPSLTSLDGLQNLISVGAHLRINNVGIVNLNGLEQLTRIGGGFHLIELPQLNSLSGLSSLGFANAIEINNNPVLTSINSLQNLTSVGVYIEIHENPSLTSLNGFQRLASVGQSLYGEIHNLKIHGSPLLADIDEFQNLVSVSGDVSFHNLGISDLDGLASLTHIGRGLYLDRLPALISVSGLSSVTTVSSIWINDIPLLTSLNGFQSLTGIDGDLQIHEGAVLADVTGLLNLVSVGGGLSLYNLGLTSLNGLGQLESIGAGLSIERLPLLTSLEGLAVLDTIGTFVNVVHNAALTACVVEVFCEMLANIPGQINFVGNATGCATNGEVMDACSGLPVSLVSFGVRLEGHIAHLSWETTSETNSGYFEVQHTTDVRNWDILGRVMSVGESTVLRNYTFSHTALSDGIHYYRLKMVDKDGSFEYSPVKSLSLQRVGGLVAWPNPATDRLRLKRAEDIDRLELSDATGTHVFIVDSVPGDGIDLSRFSSGVYTIRVVMNDGSRFSEKIVIIK